MGKTNLIRDLFKFLKRVGNRIEVDMYLREISRALDVSLEALYAEFNGIREKHASASTVEKGETFSLGEILAAYCTLYGFYDLFSKNFPYTSEHCREIPSFSVLERIIATKNPDDAGIDIDRHRAVELSIEVENERSTRSEAAIQSEFLKLLKKAMEIAYATEFHETMEKLDPSDEIAVNSAMIRLQKKAQELGISHRLKPRTFPTN